MRKLLFSLLAITCFCTASRASGIAADTSMPCAESFEPNDNDIIAPEIPVNTTIVSKLSSDSDHDFYVFYNATNAYYFEVRVDNLWPGCRVHLTDYFLVGVGFDHVDWGEDYASIRVFEGGQEYFVVHVDPYLGGGNPDRCYELRINVPDAALATATTSDKPGTGSQLMKVHPLPATNKVIMETEANNQQETSITVSDLKGHVLHTQQYALSEGNNKLEITLPENLGKGVYVLSDGKAGKKAIIKN